MLNIAYDKKSNFQNKKLTKFHIEKLYNGNNKSLIGLEYERLSLDKETLENASYDKLEKILKTFCEIHKWDLVYDDNIIIGAVSKNTTSISLEPGCQLEISIRAYDNILSIENELKEIIESIDEIALYFGVFFLGYGISPKTPVDNISLLQKRRYKIMNNYLPYRNYGELSTKMMRQSAGIQINIDYKNEYDAYLKMKFFNLVMPFISGMCANSPLENNNISNIKSLRTNVWCYTGLERCNFFYKDVFNFSLFKNNFYKKYINEILKVPMIFIERKNSIIEINGKITFEEFLKNGYLGYFATLEDYILHQSLCFPDVRMKKCIEIRNHDSSNPQMALALCAFYKGLVKEDVKKLLSQFKFLKINKVEKYNKNIIKNGLETKIGCNIDGWDVVQKLFTISKNNLSASDRSYLEPIFNIIKNRKTQSDLILENKISNSKELVEFINKY